MMYKASISTELDVYDAFRAELKDVKGDRSEYRIKKTGKGTEFEIKAKDSVALRAVLNSITKLLSVHEKMAKIR